MLRLVENHDWVIYSIFGCIVALVFALARPQVRNDQRQLLGEGIDIVLCMDVSGSMNSTDIKPSRMEVAKQMALSVQAKFKTDFAIATTGNAGPLKGDSVAEVGTVFIALATPKGVIVEEFNFGQPREKVIDRAVNKAFEMLYKEILKN